jgi:two-component system sensor histidine kinase/response regulator
MKPRPDGTDHTARVLIVDDERHNRELLEVMLTPEGFHLETASSGEEALAMIAQRAPDLILLDVMMPGMDGYEVAAKIKGNHATESIPVIMVTALDDRNARMLGLNAGAEDFLSKPVDRAELCVRVRNLLRLKAYGAYQLRFKDEFLSHVSHELRSPLTAIKQFTTILLGGLAGELNNEQREYQKIVLKNIRQLQSMIDDLLEVTRLETGKLTVEPESVFVANAVIDAFNTLQVTALAKGVRLSYDLPPDLPAANADPTRLRQILIILIENAIKFTPDAGLVRVEVRLARQHPDSLLFEVSDTGCGIDPEITDRIFERHFQVTEHIQSSRKGLGLGLYICKELVNRQGGQIWVERRPAGGTTFSFTLPVFSLNKSLAPLLKNNRWPSESVALVMVETCFPNAWPSADSHEAWSDEARSVLQRCLLPDLDVLLPTSSSAAGELFFVAVFADERGASVLANRIRQQFELLPRLKQTGLTLSVSYKMLESAAPDVGASADDIVTSMAMNLEESIKSQTHPEVVLS